MPPEIGPSLLILVVFVLPGFVTVLIKERTHETNTDPTPFDRLLRVLYYSVWSYLLLALFSLAAGLDLDRLIEVFNDHKDDPAQLVWRCAIAALAPALIIATAGRLWDSSKLRRRVLKELGINARHTVPTAWDHAFRLGRSALVRATMKEGSVVAGFYGPQSFAAYSKDGRDLYLQQRWVLDEDNWFSEADQSSLGVWVVGEETVAVEFYTWPDAGEQGKPEAERRPDQEGGSPGSEAAGPASDDAPTEAAGAEDSQ